MRIGVSIGLVAAVAICVHAQSSTGFDGLLLAGRTADAGKLAQTEVDRLTGANQTQTAAFAAALDRLASAEARNLDPEARVRKTVDDAIALHTRLEGATSPGIGAALTALGDYQSLRTNYKGAQATYEKALALEEAGSSVPVMQLTQTLNGLGQALTSLDQAKPAIEVHQRALALREKEFGKTDLRVIETLNLLARDYLNTDLVRAAGYFQQSVDLAAQSGHSDHILAVQAAFGLANSLRERGRCADAAPLYRRVLNSYEALLGAGNVRLVGPLNNFGMCLKELGDYPGGRATLERGIAITRQTGASANTAVLLSNLGIILKESGDYAGARQAYEQASPELEKVYGPVHSQVASNLNSRGILLVDMGDFADARPLLERALAIYEKVLPGNPKTVEVMGRVGSCLREMGDLAGSRALLERAWRTNKEKLGADSLYAVNILEQLGLTMLQQRDFDGAEAAMREVLRAREGKIEPVSEQFAHIHFSLGQVLAGRGDNAGALGEFESALAIDRKVYGPDSPKTADVLANEAGILDKLKRKPEAVAAAVESARVARDNLILTAQTLPERQALLYANASRAGVQIAARLAPESSPDLRRQAWDAVVRDRALILDEMSQRRRTAAEAANPKVGALFIQAEDARRALAAAVIQDAPLSRVTERRRAAESAERALALESAAFRAELAGRKFGLAGALASLPERSALVSYYRVDDRYIAFAAVSAGAEPAAIDLGSAAHIDKLVADWRAQIDAERDSLGRNAAAHEAACRTAGAALRRAVWDPIARAIPGVRAVYVTPDGALLSVNLSALPSGDKSYLVETGPLVYVLTAERDLVRSVAPHSASTRLLAVGNPAFDARLPGSSASPVQPASLSSAPHDRSRLRGDRSTCASFDAMRFSPLPGTALEAQEVAALGRNAGLTASLLEGSQASVAALRGAVPGIRILHLATHGFFLENTCRADPTLVENPLVRSGLALAGANRRASESSSDDGLLTAEEAASLNLDGADLVVLSGCDTGRGQIENGEGVLGLRRAFRIAGAATLVTSLWPAADDDARHWMASFYRAYLGRKLTAAEAVRAAAIATLHARRAAGKSTHPFYWAAFLASGAPQ